MKSVLLVIDMQTYFESMVSTALPNVLKLVSHFQSRGLPIVFTQHGHTDKELTPPYRNQLVRKWGPEGSIRVGTKGWHFLPDIKDALHYSLSGSPPSSSAMIVVAKNTYDAFLGTGDLTETALEDFLRNEGVERVVVCGVMTDCCCDTTARGAFNRGFETWMVSNACGTANKTQHERGDRKSVV